MAPPERSAPPSAPAETTTSSAREPSAVATPTSAAEQPASNPNPAPAACGRMPGDKIEKLRWFQGQDAECDRLETLWANVRHSDLVCKTDADCTVITTDGN